MAFVVRPVSLAEAIAIEALIPEFAGSKLAQESGRMAGREMLLLGAYWEGEPAGYKVGYALSPTEFYSWLGGVTPAYRRQGVATQLRLEQEHWATENGYASILVKSSNRFPAMLQLLLASGYQIVGYEERGDPLSSKISFRKQL